MITSALPIARNAFKESIRQPVFFIMLLLAAFLQLLNTWIVGFSMGANNVPGEVTGDDKLLLDVSMGAIFLLGILLAAFISTAAISREIENKTVLTVVSKPVGRTSIILGKFLGISVAMFVAVGVMIAYLLLGIRHGVLANAAQDPNYPLIIFVVGAIFGSIFLAALGNYLNGWAFGQLASLLLLPLIWIAYIASLFVDEDWSMMNPGENLKPQIMLACLCLAMALFVMTALATAVSTRLGQVVTIAICTGVFVIGLLSNYWFGRGIYENERFGVVAMTASPLEVDMFDFHRQAVYELVAKRTGMTPEEFEERGYDPRRYVQSQELLSFDDSELADNFAYNEFMLRTPGSNMLISLLGPPKFQIKVGDPVYYSSSPSGIAMVTPNFEPLDPSLIPEPSDEPNLNTDPNTEIEPDPENMLGKNTRELPGLFITAINDDIIEIMQIGREVLPVSRPPMTGDSLFLQPTIVHRGPQIIWSVVPNMQSFWLLDAVTQNQPIPLKHVALVFFYGVCQIVVFLSIAVLSFQGRDVG